MNKEQVVITGMARTPMEAFREVYLVKKLQI